MGIVLIVGIRQARRFNPHQECWKAQLPSSEQGVPFLGFSHEGIYAVYLFLPVVGYIFFL